MSSAESKDERLPTADAADRVALYPSFGHLSKDRRNWQIEVTGHVSRAASEGLRQRMAIHVLQRLFGTSPADAETTRFRERLEPFFDEAARGRRLRVLIGDQEHHLRRPTCRGGHFRELINVPAAEAHQLCLGWSGQEDWLAVRVATPGSNAGLANPWQAVEGAVQLIGPCGLSVISDIDDTIKQSEVADKRQLLRNTFLNEFQAVPGMADVYRAWAAEGAVFHYVSSSPWQLLSSLRSFLDESGFPRGSFHLRTVRVYGAGLLRLFSSRRSIKSRWIRSILRQFPDRSFILVGDSGEKDPEIYGAIAREFPTQIARIFVRRVAGRTPHMERLRHAFRGLDTSVWQLVEEPAEMLSWPASAGVRASAGLSLSGGG